MLIIIITVYLITLWLCIVAVVGKVRDRVIKGREVHRALLNITLSMILVILGLIYKEVSIVNVMLIASSISSLILTVFRGGAFNDK